MIDCECKNWCSDGSLPLTTHHKKCEHYNPVKDLMEAMAALIKGIECWASDEDGVHPECFDAYKRCKGMLGQFDFKEGVE